MSSSSEVQQRLTDPSPLAIDALLARLADGLDHRLFELVAGRIEQAIADGTDDARLYQLLGVARRELLDSTGAIAAFERAARLAPRDVRIAHGLARCTWEAGFPAAARYRQALALAPTDAGILVGEAAALVAEGRGLEAETRMRQLLDSNPGWHEGHAAFARLVAASGSGTDGTATVRRALAAHPRDAMLWRLLLRLLLDAARYADAVEAAGEAAARLGDGDEWRRARAIALSELGEAAQAQLAFDRLPEETTGGGLAQRVRNLVRLGRLADALALAERSPTNGDEAVLWPYRAILWRLHGDARWSWLEGDPRLIGSYDLGFSPGELEQLAGVLRALHGRSGLLPDQSVRGGTQTDGNLLARAEPEIQALRTAIMKAVAAHVAQLPPRIPGHPTLGGEREPLRISGSWSVRLSGAGFHVDHVHPRGWFSSAFYVALPGGADDREEGWLAFGECRSLLPEFAGFKLIKPVAGQLVLFPSTTWHGTRPFAAGERMTVAFDVARP